MAKLAGLYKRHHKKLHMVILIYIWYVIAKCLDIVPYIQRVQQLYETFWMKGETPLITTLLIH